jgi:hypothetical protein
MVHAYLQTSPASLGIPSQFPFYFSFFFFLLLRAKPKNIYLSEIISSGRIREWQRQVKTSVCSLAKHARDASYLPSQI